MKYYKLKAEKKYRRERKKAMLKLGLDPEDPASDQIVEEMKIEESEKDEEEESGSEDDKGSEIEITSDMDIFDIIKLSKSKES